MSFPVAGFRQMMLVEVHATPLSDEASGSAEVRSRSTQCLLLGCLSEDHVGLGRKARLQCVGSQPALQLGGLALPTATAAPCRAAGAGGCCPQSQEREVTLPAGQEGTTPVPALLRPCRSSEQGQHYT